MLKNSDDQIVVENSMSAEWTRRLHVMGNKPPIDGWCDYVPDGVARELKRYTEAGVHHLEIEWRAREATVLRFQAMEFALTRHAVVWALEPENRVSVEAQKAIEAFRHFYGHAPDNICIKRLPRGVDDGVALTLPSPDGRGEEILLIQADWVPEGFLSVNDAARIVWTKEI
jgi:hypothetical protein